MDVTPVTASRFDSFMSDFTGMNGLHNKFLPSGS